MFEAEGDAHALVRWTFDEEPGGTQEETEERLVKFMKLFLSPTLPLFASIIFDLIV